MDSRQQSDSHRFDAAASRLFAALQDGSAVSGEDYAAVSRWLVRWLERAFDFSRPDSEEATQEVLLRVAELAQASRPAIDAVERPGAYLMRLARNHAIDRTRRAARRDIALSEELSAVLPGHDDAIAALLDATATTAAVRAAMRAAGQAGDRVARQVVRAWLDLAEEVGAAPSSREVGRRVGVSHTTVNHALERFKSFFPADTADSIER
jgi:DNA-directed RNA polymerase specialized sigma24 family protein